MDDDKQRFEEIFLPHLDSAYNLARWLLHSDEDAQDIVQDAYMKAVKAFPRFRGGDGRAWLLTIVRNTAFTWIRKHRPEAESAPFEEEIHTPITPTPAEDFAAVIEERKEWLHQALEKLPAEFREVIVLHEMEELSYKEIAAMLDVPVGTVMSRLSRARERLQAEAAKFQKLEETP